MTVLDWDEHSDFEVIQFSKYDTVNDLHSRFKNADRYESFKLLKVNCLKESIHNVINKYKDFYKNGGEFNYRISKIIPSDECVMCLALDDQSLLIVEHIQSSKVITSSPLLKISHKIKNEEIKLKGNSCFINVHINF